MPYKYNDVWHRRQREYITKKERAGKLYPSGARQYRVWLHQAWEILGKPDPADLTLEQLENLEQVWPIGENSKANRLRVVRHFLRKYGCKAALEWEIRAQARPKVDRRYLSEQAVTDLRKVARAMGPEYELIFSLGVDNSLRAGDISRLTLSEAKDLLWNGQAVITCKGRQGGKRRLLIMHRITREPLQEYLKLRSGMVENAGYDPGNLLLSKHRGKLINMSAHSVANRDEALGERAGIELRSHDLRATFGNRHWKHGTDLAIIAMLMGHESPNQTFKAYIGVSQEDMRLAQDSLGPQV